MKPPAGECPWPVGLEGFEEPWWCGAPKADGSPYCEAHGARVRILALPARIGLLSAAVLKAPRADALPSEAKADR